MKHALGPEHVPPPDELDLERLAAAWRMRRGSYAGLPPHHRQRHALLMSWQTFATRAGAIVIAKNRAQAADALRANGTQPMPPHS